MTSTGYVKTKCGNIFQPETGKLFIFDDHSVSVLRGWPVMRAWKKTCVKHPNWTGFRPSLSQLEAELRDSGDKMEAYRRIIEAGQLELPLEFRYRDEANPYRSELSRWYFETTPREVRDLLRPFWNSRWALMTLLVIGGSPAADLLKSCPALAFMLANNRVFHAPAVSQPRRAIRTWLSSGKTRRQLLAWLGFPASTGLARLLAKVPAQDLSIGLLLKLRTLLADPRSGKLLRHQPIIDRALLAFFEPGMREILTAKLLAELRNDLLENVIAECFVNTMPELVARERERPRRQWQKEAQPAWQLLRDTARMFGERHPDRPMPQICDLAALRRFHDRLAEEFTAERFGKLKFTPPVPGNADIVPLTGYDMLLEEGRLQHNCAASYCEEVAAGRSFLYRVLSPERCTLELALRKGKWEVVQLLAACNRPPQEETKIAVAKWLKEFQKNNRGGNA